MDINNIIEGCKKQDIKAQAELYNKYKNNLFVLCLKYCNNKEEAQDNLQDTFMDIYKNIKSFKGKGSFEGWMKRIAINKAIDRYKYKSHLNIILNEQLTTIDTDIEQSILDVISLDDILHHIQQLPPKYRLVFNLYELDDYSHNEIAELLQISINTSKSNLHRAKQILKEKINKVYYNEHKMKYHGN